MATLVLTVVGGVVGGPVGAAIGAVIGQQVDAIIFRPKGREGPRLADLKVQMSTYGQQIPRLYGTMRVAGSVIWATDLIEHRNRSGGGKNRPSVTTYSYSTSLAVALSSRRIRAVKRIWADGNLLRTSDGRFRERCVFRSYLGSEDQMPDPLIASAVGAGAASGFRGMAYVVFEGLELGAFGNRIPSLTFEVEADASAVDSGVIGNDLLNEAGRCVGQWPIQGYAAMGVRVRDALAPLMEIDRISLISGNGDWRLAPPHLTGAAALMGQFERHGRQAEPADVAERVRRPLSALPATIRVRHYEPERDYQTGQQMSAVAGGGYSEQMIDVPAVLPASSARALAAWLAAAVSDGRELVQWQGDLAALALGVGMLIRLQDGSQWRVSGRVFREDKVTVELARHQRVPPPFYGADGGAAIPAPEWPAAQGMVRLFDMPNINGVARNAPHIIMAAAGSEAGWRGADCWFVASVDAPPVMLGTLRGAAAMGALVEAGAVGTPHLIDDITSLRVQLAHEGMSLTSVDDVQLLAGANRAMLGDELIQFGSAVLENSPESEGRIWRLSHLLRARGGQMVTQAHDVGTPFLLLDEDGVMSLPDSLAQLASGGGSVVEWAERNDNDMTRVAVPSSMMAVRPLSPVHGQVRVANDGHLQLKWVRRSRVNLGWRDEVDVPLGESMERWRIQVIPTVAELGPWESDKAEWVISAEDRARMATGSVAEIHQIGDFAMSPPLIIPLP